jgi:hypothetical protein
MRIEHLAAYFAMVGAEAVEQRAARERDYLLSKGWVGVCVVPKYDGAGGERWTHPEVAESAGAPVTLQHAVWIQRTADVIAKTFTEE